jgi:CO/xanthine dehydrogenase FAD-binding subunit
MNYCRPTHLDEALGLLHTGPHKVLAGATDVFPAAASAQAWGAAPLHAREDQRFLDISNVEELTQIRQHPETVEIGAGVTWSQLLDAELPAWFDCLRGAADEVGGRQIQNRGTIAGNLCNASPAADGVPPLLALDARVRLQAQGHTREVGLQDFVVGNRATTLAADELLTAIVIPVPTSDAFTSFLKLGARKFLIISIAMVAARLDISAGQVTEARIAVGACGPVARRLPTLEARYLGRRVADLRAECEAADVATLTPINDIRASAGYRTQAAAVLVRRALEQVLAKLPVAA